MPEPLLPVVREEGPTTTQGGLLAELPAPDSVGLSC